MLAKNLDAAHRYRKTIEKLADTSSFSEKKNFHERIDALRIFVNRNTEHQIDEKFYAIWNNPQKMADSVLSYAHGKQSEKPHFECATRTNLMAQILATKGYNIRIIDLHDAQEFETGVHTFLEVYNPEKKAWEAQDPDYDIYWKSNHSDARLSVLDILKDPKNAIPCNAGACGWDIKSAENTQALHLKNIFEIISVNHPANNQGFTTHQPEICTKNLKSENFCKIISKKYRHTVIDINEFEQENLNVSKNP